MCGIDIGSTVVLNELIKYFAIDSELVMWTVSIER